MYRKNTLKSIDNIHMLSSDTALATRDVSVSVHEQKAGAEQLAALALKLNEMAQNLNKAVEILKLIRRTLFIKIFSRVSVISRNGYNIDI